MNITENTIFGSAQAEDPLEIISLSRKWVSSDRINGRSTVNQMKEKTITSVFSTFPLPWNRSHPLINLNLAQSRRRIVKINIFIPCHCRRKRSWGCNKCSHTLRIRSRIFRRCSRAGRPFPRPPTSNASSGWS